VRALVGSLRFLLGEALACREHEEAVQLDLLRVLACRARDDRIASMNP
jgi:hypothetical protein